MKNPLLTSISLAALLAASQAMADSNATTSSDAMPSSDQTQSLETAPAAPADPGAANVQPGSTDGMTAAPSDPTADSGAPAVDTNAAASAPTATDTGTTADIARDAQAGDWMASTLIGRAVYNTEGQNVGDVNDIVLSSSGEVSSIVIGVGGFLGLGEKNVALPFEALRVSSVDGSDRITIDSTKEALEKAPEFVRSDDQFGADPATGNAQ
ncbi:MAG: PRC-barrel domain-containing protein [Hyphomicrobiaceae bacterium]